MITERRNITQQILLMPAYCISMQSTGNIEPCKKLKILILGGGPIGLFAGYKLLKHGHCVTIFEKRKEHTRHNILSLGHSMNGEMTSLDTISIIPSEIMDELDAKSSFSNINVNGNKCLRNTLKRKPYLMPSSRTYYIVLNELEIAYEKHFKIRGGVLLKPTESKAFTDIRIEKDILSYAENDEKKSIDINNFDIVFINDGARSYYREIYFKKTSFTEHEVNNILYYGLTADNENIAVHNNPDELNPLAYGLILIHDIKNKTEFLEKFKVVDKLKKKTDFEYIYQLSNEHDNFTNGLSVEQILNENNKKDKTSRLDSQNLFRMFVCENYLYISIMVNPIDVEDWKPEDNRTSNIPFDDLPDNVQSYLEFALYYYDLSEFIDPRSVDNNINLFPLKFSSVSQSCTFIKKNDDDYRFIALCGDAMASGNFHAGIVLNKNLMAVNSICNLIDEYVDSYPKDQQGNLDKEFLRLLFFNGNLHNQEIRNEIIAKSISHLINFHQVDQSNLVFNLSDILNELKDVIICKNCTIKNKLLCKNSAAFIKYIVENSQKDVLTRIVKYLLLSGEHKYTHIINLIHL